MSRNYDARSMWQAPDGATACYYCGAVAETIDHVVPQIVLQTAALSNDEAVTKYLHRRHRVMTVPACRECNGLAGAKFFDTLEERRQHVKNALRRRYRRLLESPDWGDTELMDLDAPLRGLILNTLEVRRLVRLRVAYQGNSRAQAAA